MWAAIVNSQWSAWVHWRTIRRTRKQSREAFLDMWEPHAHKKALENVRFARVIVSEAPNEQ
jgi:hypothetical protein